MPITLLGHPSGTREVAFECNPRAIGVSVWVDAQHDPRDIKPVGEQVFGLSYSNPLDIL